MNAAQLQGLQAHALRMLTMREGCSQQPFRELRASGLALGICEPAWHTLFLVHGIRWYRRTCHDRYYCKHPRDQILYIDRVPVSSFAAFAESDCIR